MTGQDARYTTRRGRTGAVLVAALVLALALPALPVSASVSASKSIVEPTWGDFVPVDAYEVDDTPATASRITADGALQTRTLHDYADVDWIAFDAVRGGTYVLEGGVGIFDRLSAQAVTPVIMPDVPWAIAVVSVYASDGVTRLFSNTSAMEFYAKAAGTDASITEFPYGTLSWTAPATGRYFIRVSPYVAFTTGQYVVGVRKVVPQITGRVVGDDGAPIAGVLVGPDSTGDATKSRAYGVLDGGAITDSDGRYAIVTAPDGPNVVRFDGFLAEQEDLYYDSEYYDDASEWESATPVAVHNGSTVRGVDATLSLHPPDISGVVHDQFGHPIEGLYVRLWYTWDGGTNWSVWWTSETDAEGKFAFNNVAWFDAIRLEYCDADGYGATYGSKYWQDAVVFSSAATITPADYPITCDTTMQAQFAFSGRVVDESGTPVPDIRVTAVVASTGAQVGSTDYADTNGRWAIGGIADGTGVNVRFGSDSLPYVVEYYDDAVSRADAETLTADSAHPLTSVDATLAAAGPVFAGVVTDKLTGVPLEGVEVWAYLFGTFPADVCLTAADGSFGFTQLWDVPVTFRFVENSGKYADEWYHDEVFRSAAELVYGPETRGEPVVVDESLAPKAERISARTRYSTAASIAAEAFPGWVGVTDVVIASGDSRATPDALSASGLCWAYDAPMLLTAPGSVPTVTVETLEAIVAANGPVGIHVVGGAGPIPEAQLDRFRSLVGTVNVERTAGADRFATAAQVATEMVNVRDDAPSRVFLVNGTSIGGFFDALALSPATVRSGVPILLVGRDAVPKATDLFMDQFAPEEVYVAGGTAAVSNAVYAAVGADGRMAGIDRYATARAVADKAFAEGWLGVQRVGVAATIPDGLTGGVLLGRRNAPLLLTATAYLPAATRSYLRTNRIDILDCAVMGGTGAVSEAVRNEITLTLKP